MECTLYTLAYKPEFGTCLPIEGAIYHMKAIHVMRLVCWLIVLSAVLATNIRVAMILQRHRRKIAKLDVTNRTNTMSVLQDAFKSFTVVQYMILVASVAMIPTIITSAI